MSKLNEAIDRIAICAEERKYQNIFRSWISFIFPNNINFSYLTEEQLNLFPIKTKPRLSEIEIEQIVQDYAFKLPKEIYDLYQRGNGNGLPIGLNRNYDSWINYFPFPDTDTSWYHLQEAMNLYEGIKNYPEIDSKLFPLFASEWYLWMVEGNEEQKEISPVFAIDQGSGNFSHIVAPSMTSILLACAEKIEKNFKNIPTEYLIDKYKIFDGSLLEALIG